MTKTVKLRAGSILMMFISVLLLVNDFSSEERTIFGLYLHFSLLALGAFYLCLSFRKNPSSADSTTNRTMSLKAYVWSCAGGLVVTFFGLYYLEARQGAIIALALGTTIVFMILFAILMRRRGYLQ